MLLLPSSPRALLCTSQRLHRLALTPFSADVLSAPPAAAAAAAPLPRRRRRAVLPPPPRALLLPTDGGGGGEAPALRIAIECGFGDVVGHNRRESCSLAKQLEESMGRCRRSGLLVDLQFTSACLMSSPDP